MKPCPKCNKKINLSSIATLVLMILITTYLNTYSKLSFFSVFFRGLLVAIVTMVVYISVIVIIPWQEK